MRGLLKKQMHDKCVARCLLKNECTTKMWLVKKRLHYKYVTRYKTIALQTRDKTIALQTRDSLLCVIRLNNKKTPR